MVAQVQVPNNDARCPTACPELAEGFALLLTKIAGGNWDTGLVSYSSQYVLESGIIAHKIPHRMGLHLTQIPVPALYG